MEQLPVFFLDLMPEDFRSHADGEDGGQNGLNDQTASAGINIGIDGFRHGGEGRGQNQKGRGQTASARPTVDSLGRKRHDTGLNNGEARFHLSQCAKAIFEFECHPNWRGTL